MPPALYDSLTPWYRLIDPPADHAEEAAVFTAAFERVISPAPKTLLELGAGAGHNGLHLKNRFRCTLSELSPAMQALSRALNPECEHHLGDMRMARLGKTFDAVLVHDAIMYMLSEADLRAAVETAYVHTRAGGAAIFAPDCLRETFAESCEQEGSDEGARSARFLMWTWDPEPRDDTYLVDFAFMLRDGKAPVQVVHDRHVEGLFSEATWLRVLKNAGFEVERLARPLGDGAFDQIFLGRKR